MRRRFTPVLASLAILMSSAAAGQTDPDNPTCPKALNWSTNPQMRFTFEEKNGLKILRAEGPID